MTTCFKTLNINEKKSNDSLFIDRCFLFPLTCLSLVTFSRNLSQIFRRDRSTYVPNILPKFYTLEVMTHFLAEESNKLIS